MKVLLPVDGSRYTKRMLGYLAANEKLAGRGDTYTVLTVIPPLTNHVTAFLDAQTVRQYYEERASDVLHPIKAFADMQHWPVEFTQLVGHPGETIADYASKHKFDLIIMGSHGHSSLANVILGSVTQQVLARCQIPVLIVR